MKVIASIFLGVVLFLSACNMPSLLERDQPEEIIPVEPTEGEPELTDNQPDLSPGKLQSVKPANFYQVEAGQPKHIENIAYPASKCAWSGVGGQVFNHPGKPVSGLYAQVRGVVDGKLFLRISIIGAAEEFGPGGYRVTLANRLSATKGNLSIQLYDTNGQPRSPRVPFDTYNSCKKNLVKVNFVAAPNAVKMHMPLIMYRPEAAP